MVQTIKNTHNELLRIINDYFEFVNDNNIYYIRNIIKDDLVNKIIEKLRNEIITYFFNIEKIYKKTNYFFRLCVMNKYCKTIETRINSFT